MSLRIERGAASVRLRSREADAELYAKPGLDGLPQERPLTVEINGRPVATLLCTPDAPAELGVGWAFAQGFVDRRDHLHCVTTHADRVSLMVEAEADGGGEWSRMVKAGFDAGTVLIPHGDGEASGLNDRVASGDWRIPRSRFLAVRERAFIRFRDDDGDGGFQHAGVADERLVRCIARDVCRHNAVDKVIGWAFLEEVPRKRMILLLSGRISANVAFKAWRAGIAVVASSGLPTREAVGLADARRLTLVGRALDAQPTVYTHAWRLTDDDGVS